MELSRRDGNEALPTSPARLSRELIPEATGGRHSPRDSIAIFSGSSTHGVAVAKLTFRVGEADERLGTRGQCHLLAALVLANITVAPEVTVTPTITTLRTSFTVTGPDEAVVRTLNQIAQAIALLRTDALAPLAQHVLTAWKPLERWDTTLSSLRFGGRGYGLSGFPLLGLRHLDEDVFSEWVRSWFTCTNAVLSTNRELPAGLDLALLGDGIRKSLPDPHQVRLPFPVIAGGTDDLLAFSFLTRYDATAELGIALLIDRLTNRANEIVASPQRPKVITRRSGLGLATIAIAFAAPNDGVGALRDSFSSEFFTYAMNGPGEEALQSAQVHLRRNQNDPRPGEGTPEEAQAVAALFGEVADVASALRVEPPEIAKIVRDFLPQLIWLVPDSVSVSDQRLTRVAIGNDQPIDGQDVAAIGGQAAPRLIAGTTGLSFIDGSATTTIRFADVVALERFPDGSRTLWSANGQTIHVAARVWADANRIGAWIDSCVEPWVILGTPEQRA